MDRLRSDFVALGFPKAFVDCPAPKMDIKGASGVVKCKWFVESSVSIITMSKFNMYADNTQYPGSM